AATLTPGDISAGRAPGRRHEERRRGVEQRAIARIDDVTKITPPRFEVAGVHWLPDSMQYGSRERPGKPDDCYRTRSRSSRGCHDRIADIHAGRSPAASQRFNAC